MARFRTFRIQDPQVKKHKTAAGDNEIKDAIAIGSGSEVEVEE